MSHVEEVREVLIAERGYSTPMVDRIIAAFIRAKFAPDDWMKTLAGLDEQELRSIALSGPPAKSCSPKPPPSPPISTGRSLSPPPPRSVSPMPPPRGLQPTSSHAVPRGLAPTTSHALEPEEEQAKRMAMAGPGGSSSDEDDDDGSGLTRQYTHRTAEFMNHRRAEMERKILAVKREQEKIAMYGDDEIIVAKSKRFTTGFSSTIGKRRSMEDVITEHGCLRGREDEDFFGVYDGHGGKSVATYVGMHLHTHMAAALDALTEESDAAVLAAMAHAFEVMNADIEKELGDEANECGTCAVVALVLKDRIFVANCGDCRAVIKHGTEALRLSVDHKPGLASEKARIEAAGGCVVGGGPGGNASATARVDGLIAVSRAFGDFFFAGRIVPTPYSSATCLGPSDEFVILACDGVWDVVEDAEATKIVSDVVTRRGTPELASDALCDEASKRGSSDNISIMVVMLRDVATSDEVIGYFTARRRGKLGIIFGDSWPCIKKIAASSLAAAQEQLTVGLRLVAINGTPIDNPEGDGTVMPFAEAKNLVAARPLSLIFKAA